MKLDLYGVKVLEAIKRDGRWLLFYPGNDGKKRRATDITIPGHIKEEDVVSYLEDLLHEWASHSHPCIVVQK
jgi:hypothetical protein